MFWGGNLRHVEPIKSGKSMWTGGDGSQEALLNDVELFLLTLVFPFMHSAESAGLYVRPVCRLLAGRAAES